MNTVADWKQVVKWNLYTNVHKLPIHDSEKGKQPKY
jgi:hypothetical protein